MTDHPPAVPPMFTAADFEKESDYCVSHLADHERSDPFRLAAMLKQAAAQARELETVKAELAELKYLTSSAQPAATEEPPRAGEPLRVPNHPMPDPREWLPKEPR